VNSFQGCETTSLTHPLRRGRRASLLGFGVVAVSAAQQGALSCQLDPLRMERKLPRGTGLWVWSRLCIALKGYHAEEGSGLKHGGSELGMVPRSSLAGVRLCW
jgi:hypothetical protein